MTQDGEIEDDRMYDEMDDAFWDELYGKEAKKRRRELGKAERQARPKKVRRPREGLLPGEKGAGAGTQIAFVSARHGRYVTAIKKIRHVDPNAIEYTKIPSEVPRSWAIIGCGAISSPIMATSSLVWRFT